MPYLPKCWFTYQALLFRLYTSKRQYTHLHRVNILNIDQGPIVCPLFWQQILYFESHLFNFVFLNNTIIFFPSIGNITFNTSLNLIKPTESYQVT